MPGTVWRNIGSLWRQCRGTGRPDTRPPPLPRLGCLSVPVSHFPILLLQHRPSTNTINAPFRCSYIVDLPKHLRTFITKSSESIFIPSKISRRIFLIFNFHRNSSSHSDYDARQGFHYYYYYKGSLIKLRYTE